MNRDDDTPAAPVDPLADALSARAKEKAEAPPPMEEGPWSALEQKSEPAAAPKPAAVPSTIGQPLPTSGGQATPSRPAGPRYGIIEAAEPLFHLVCRFNRAGRSNLSPPESVVREQIALTLEECETRFTDGRNGLDEQKLDRFRRPLNFFADFIIRNSALTCAFDWHARPLAHARYGEMAGDDVFFEEHQREMQTDDALATELLRLYHECMALGFSGAYQYEPQRVGDLMAATRAELRVEASVPSKIRTATSRRRRTHTPTSPSCRPATATGSSASS